MAGGIGSSLDSLHLGNRDEFILGYDLRFQVCWLLQDVSDSQSFRVSQVVNGIGPQVPDMTGGWDASPMSWSSAINA